MASDLCEESEDLTTCSVFLCEYNENMRWPKFLPICCHTICLSCLKDLQRDQKIMCPLCRKVSDCVDVASLPNNSSTLHILKLTKKMKNEESNNKAEIEKWCFTCITAANLDCILNNHLSIDMRGDQGNDPLKNMETLLILKETMAAKKRESQSTMKQVIELKEEAQKYLSLISGALYSISKKHAKVVDQNDISLAKFNSILGDVPRHQDHFIPELISLMNDSTKADTIESLNCKMSAMFCQSFDSELNAAYAKFTELKKRKNIKMKIEFLGEEDEPFGSIVVEPLKHWPNDVKDLTLEQKESLILSHLAFSISNHKELVAIQPAAAESHPSVASFEAYTEPFNNFPVTNTPVEYLEDSISSFHHSGEQLDAMAPITPANAYPIRSTTGPIMQANNYNVAPSVKKSRTTWNLSLFFNIFNPQQIGYVQIEPLLSSPYSDLIMQLCEFTFNSNPDLGLFNRSSLLTQIAVPGVYLLMRFVAHSHHVPTFMQCLQQSYFRKTDSLENLTCNIGDVGVTMMTTDDYNRLTGWSFVFPLENFLHPANAHHIDWFPPAFLVGRIADPPSMNWIQHIASSPYYEGLQGNNFTFSLSSSSTCGK